jgi:peptide methionine sulfoxide reductase MsrA
VAHDPTQLNRQGPDEGTQYRSEIFATSGAQQQAAEAYIAELDKAKAFAGRIVTKVEPLKAFYRAEPYHQDYAHAASQQPLHRRLRPAENRKFEKALPGTPSRTGGARQRSPKQEEP